MNSLYTLVFSTVKCNQSERTEVVGGGKETQRKKKLREMERHNKEGLLPLLSANFIVDQMQRVITCMIFSFLHKKSHPKNEGLPSYMVAVFSAMLYRAGRHSVVYKRCEKTTLFLTIFSTLTVTLPGTATNLMICP